MDNIYFKRDARFEGFLLFDYPALMASLVIIYICTVLKWGPDFMKNRKPFNLQSLIRMFNLVHVFANVYFILKMAYYVLMLKVSPICPSPMFDTPYDKPLAEIVNFYLYVRLSNFLDTLFFVLQKKQSHVSLLHVYHHVCVVGNMYLYFRSGWGFILTYVALLNASIQVLIYVYFLLSTFESVQPYLWWKKYITVLQLTQFGVLLMHAIVIMLYGCGYSTAVVFNGMANAAIFLVLYGQFYRKTYKTKQ